MLLFRNLRHRRLWWRQAREGHAAACSGPQSRARELKEPGGRNACAHLSSESAQRSAGRLSPHAGALVGGCRRRSPVQPTPSNPLVIVPRHQLRASATAYWATQIRLVGRSAFRVQLCCLAPPLFMHSKFHPPVEAVPSAVCIFGVLTARRRKQDG